MIDYDVTVLSDTQQEIIIKNITDYRKPQKNEASADYVLEINDDNEIIKKYGIHGEEFNIYADGENIILMHPLWSLAGIGKTLIEAERNLFKEAKDIFNHYKDYADKDLTPEAINMLEYLHKIV